MAFEQLLGNERIKENLNTSLSKGRISHFYLLCGPAGSGRHTLAKLLAAAILCQGSGKPCLSCGPCRKIMNGTHPDFITVDDPEHKNVAVKLIRSFREDVYIRPNEAEHKIYLFPQDLGLEGQNALLKTLEEPPKYGVFILLTDNPEKLLPPVRSRCVELKLQPLPENLLKRELAKQFPDAAPETIAAAAVRSGGYLGQAAELLKDSQIPQQTEDFVRALASRDSLLLTQTLVPMEKWKRDQLLQILAQWLEILESALACRSGMESVFPLARQLAAARSSADLMKAITAIRKASEYASGNVSPAAVCGWLTWELR